MSQMKFGLISHEVGELEFRCGNQSIEQMICNSYFQSVLQQAYAYQFYDDKRIYGYYMVIFEKVLLGACEEIVDGCYDDSIPYYFAVHIQYLAVDEKYQHKRIGKNVLNYIVKDIRNLSVRWPIRLITIDALKDKYEWYIDNGFLPFDETDLMNENATIRMYIDCQTGENKKKQSQYMNMV